jgi:hypothetical protein
MCWDWLLHAYVCVHAEIMWPCRNLMTNYVFCSEFEIRSRSGIVCSEFVIHCWNWVICSKLSFAAELCVQQWNCDLLPKWYCLQRICDSLPKLSCLQRISIHCWIVCAVAILWFAAADELSAANVWFTAETEFSVAN